MIQNIGVTEAIRLQELLFDYGFDKPIDISEPNLKLSFHATGISEPTEEEEPLHYFLNENDETSVLSINGKIYPLSVFIGKWSNNAPIPNAHISLGCEYFHDFFAQIEFSYCLMDEKFLYITKNMKLSGKGAISRINGGAKTKQQKVQRREKLIQFLNLDRLYYDNQDWIYFHKISKEELWDDTKKANVTHAFWESFLTYAFKIEAIIKEDSSPIIQSDTM